MIYLFFLLVVLISLTIDRYGKLTLRATRIVRSFLFFSFCLLVGLRGPNVGVDTETYYDHYYMFGADGCDFVEIGFDWINRFCYAHKLPASSLLFTCSFLTFLPITILSYSLNKREFYVFAFLFVLVSFGSMCNIMRQCVAEGWFLYALYRYQFKTPPFFKESIIYIFILLFASLFHISALLFLPLFLLKRVNINKLCYVAIYLGSFLFVLFDFSFFIPELELFNRDFTGYAENATSSNASWLGFTIASIRNVLIFYVLYRTNAFKKYTLLSIISLISLVMANLSYHVLMLSRIAAMCSWAIILLLSITYVREKNNSNIRMIYLLVFGIYFVLSVYGLISPSNSLLPYQFYFETRYVNF